MIPLAPNTRKRVSTLPVFDNFTRYPDGAASGAMQTGQAWGVFQVGNVQNGWFDSTGTSAAYLECNTGRANITRIGAEWVFDDQGGTLTDAGATMTLISWADGGIVANGFGRRTSCHVAITRTAVLWYVRDVAGGGSVTLVSNQTISPALPVNAVVGADITVNHASGVGVTRLRDGRTYTVTDPRITQFPNEVYACWEPYYNGSATTPRIRIGRVWANGNESPPAPITPMVAAEAYASNPDNTASLSVVLPTVQSGDVILMMAEILANSNTLTQTSGPTFAKHATQNNRTGVSTALFTRTATSADSGATVTVAGSSSLPMHLGVWVLRNVVSVHTAGIAMTNQGSGNSNITVPAYTPTAGRTALQIVALGRSANAASTLTPPSNVQIVASQLPGATGVRTGLAVGVVTDWSPTLTPGTTWVNTSDHYAATWVVPINL